MLIFGNKTLDQLEHADIQGLVTRGETESIILEFKREPTTNSKELAKDVSAMANSEGGIILYGIAEDDSGKASSIQWINSTDNFPERLDNVLSSTITPQIKNKLKIIVNPDNATQEVYLVFIPKSTQLHMVIKDGDNRYYKRLNRTIQRMEHSEIIERIRLVAVQEDTLLNTVASINADFFQYSTETATGSRIDYYIIPEILNQKANVATITNNVRITDYFPPISGAINNAYKGTIVNSNRLRDSPKFWQQVMILHQNGIIEYRRTPEANFASVHEAKKLATFLRWSWKYLENINYYGGFYLVVEIRNTNQFYFTPTYGRLDGKYITGGQIIQEKIYIDPLIILTEDTLKSRLLDLIKQIAAYASVTGDGPFTDIVNLYRDRTFEYISNHE